MAAVFAIENLVRDWPVVVVGYGNTLRCDDGAGQLLAELVAAKGWPGVKVFSVHQLTPELAEPLASARLAIFLDARLASEGESVRVVSIEPGELKSTLVHFGDPRWLLALTQLAFNNCPISWLITVPAVDLGFGECMSMTAQKGLCDGLLEIDRLVNPCLRYVHSDEAGFL